jgi:hypothetical protein
MKIFITKEMVFIRMIYPNFANLLLCKGCIMGKQNKILFPKINQPTFDDILKLVHLYVCGLMQIPSLDKPNISPFS